jgi:hydrogenase maturation protease
MMMPPPRILIAGIGNIFLGDDAFGVEVARRLLQRQLPEGVRVVDFGIRGFDLAYALMDGPGLALLVDALPRDGPPGTLYVLEPDLNDLDNAPLEPHGMNPVAVLNLVQTLGGPCPPVRVIGCEPAILETENGAMGLSPPVAAAVEAAIDMITALVQEHLAGAELNVLKESVP